MRRLKILFGVALLTMAVSCTVKEDRTECPCYVSVQTDTDKECMVSFYSPDGMLLERRIISAEELVSGDNYTKVRKGDIYVSVVKNLGSMQFDGGHVISCIPGRESEPVFAFCKAAEAVEDELLVRGVLNKQYAMITVNLLNSTEEVYPYNVSLQSAYNGLDLISLEPVGGAFHLLPVVDNQNKVVFLMLRQSQEAPIDLFLLNKQTGAVVASFDLNAYILATGYNWNAEYLGDITVTIDFAKASLIIYVEDWEEVFMFNFTI